jgi:hypothetical protein
MQQPAELVVARHAELSRAQDVNGGEVHVLAVGVHEVLQVAREVVELDGARMGAPERVQEVTERQPRLDVLGLVWGPVSSRKAKSSSRSSSAAERNVQSSVISGCIR